jgi:hypothetical protein
MADYDITLTLSEDAIREILEQKFVVIASDFKQDAGLQEIFTELYAKTLEATEGLPEFATPPPAEPPIPLTVGMTLINDDVVAAIVWLKDLKLWLVSLVGGDHLFGRPEEIITLKGGQQAKLEAVPS